MIERIMDENDSKKCDELLTKLINDETKYDDKLDKNIIINNYFCNIIKNDLNILLGYKINNEIVAYLFLKKIDNGYLIDGLYVEEEYRNKRIATSLIEEALKILKSKSISNIEINVMFKNKTALKLYKKLGFTELRINLRKEI